MANQDKLKEMVHLLICPVCRRKDPKSNVGLKIEGDHLTCTSCGSEYPVNDGIPAVIEDLAKKKA